jgi:hypothetical protein
MKRRLQKQYNIVDFKVKIEKYVKDITAPKVFNFLEETQIVVRYNVWSGKVRTFQVETPEGLPFMANPSWYF